jgi:hypothetical protein
MKTILWQVKLPEDGHWLNVPEQMVSGMRARGYQVRELVDRAEAQHAIEAARETNAAVEL